jgi:spore germination cell wall hydrolase CwlJ-like protein
LDYELIPSDQVPSNNYRNPVEIFKIKPPSITAMPDPNPGIILHISSEQIVITARERTCLVRNVFYEAGGEPYEGKIAVAQVTWNRLRSGAWGRDLCGVIHAPNQFSWTQDTVKRNRPLNGAQVAAVQTAVDDFLSGIRVSKLNNATHFHAAYVRPSWATSEARVKSIGGHVFYALK